MALGQAAIPASKPATTPSTRPADEVAVVVNGKPIMESDLDQIISRGRKMTPEELAQIRERIKPQMRSLFDYAIMNELLIQAASKEGIVLTDKDWNAEFDRVFGEWVERNGWSPEQTAEQVKRQFNVDVAQLKEEMPRTAAFRMPILHERLLKKKFADEVAVKDEEIKEYYDKRLQSQYTWKEDMAKASHILLGIKDPKTQQPISEEAKKEKRKKAEEVLEEARKPGADFAALAKEYSDDPGSKTKGGDLGWFNRTRMVQPFAEAAFALQPGEMSGIVETIHGYHIIKVTGQGTAGPIPFDEVKDQIKETLEKQKTTAVMTKYREELRKEAKIVYPPGKEPASAPAVRPPATRPTGTRPTGTRPTALRPPATRPSGSIQIQRPPAKAPAR